MRHLGKYWRVCISYFIAIVFLLSFTITSYADVNDLLIGTDSNALMTLELDDGDYFPVPFSSIQSVDNTVDYSGVRLWLRLTDLESLTYDFRSIRVDDNGDVKYTVPYGYTCDAWGVQLLRSALPDSGIYDMTIDVSNAFSFDYKSAKLYSWLYNKNTYKSQSENNYTSSQFVQSSGDLYFDEIVKIGYCSGLELQVFMADGQYPNMFDFHFNVNFAPSDGTPNFTTAGSDIDSNTSYQDDVSSSLSGLSSSVDSMTEDLSSAAESLEYISSSQNLIIQGIDNVIMHISDQLYAFWDQLYNLIHLPELDMLTQIKTAIENIDLEVEVNLDKLKTSIDNMSTAVQNKLQSVQNAITNGYDNSGINQDAAELDQSLQEYDEAEQNVLEQVNDSLNDFEFDGGFEEYANTIKVFSDFLQALYESSGGFKVVINLSLMLSIAGIVIGVYRFKQGG